MNLFRTNSWIFLKRNSTYLHHVDNVVWQPKQAEGDHDGQDELFTADAAAEFSLPDPSQEANVAD